ncbi:hypothetical protein E2C01_019558 [Portunus trituberculatus]|uniref:Uncharacterized protein n=1 Tax=Portunus trituberculatus TaxID=210409 RepID=A0A5B7DXY5_PORTR|nr:hypothetical protein [Portunus trituberculatus]
MVTGVAVSLTRQHHCCLGGLACVVACNGACNACVASWHCTEELSRQGTTSCPFVALDKNYTFNLHTELTPDLRK